MRFAVGFLATVLPPLALSSHAQTGPAEFRVWSKVAKDNNIKID